MKRLYTSADLLCNAYQQTSYFEFSHEERLMPVSDNERMAIQHRLAKKKASGAYRPQTGRDGKDEQNYR